LGFGISLSSSLQFLQFRPALIYSSNPTLAVNHVSILAADRADAQATLAANPLHRQREQNVLSQNIRQLEAGAFVKGDLAFALVDLYLLGSVTHVHLRRRAVEQIKIRFNRKPRRLQAAITFGLYRNLEPPPDSNLPQRISKQFGGAFRREGRHLPQPLVQEIDFARRKGYIKVNLPQLQFLNT
jgi:hypothetical protein